MRVTFPPTKYRGDPADHPDWHDIHVGGRYVGSYSKSPTADYPSWMRWTAEVTLDYLEHDETDDDPALLAASSERELRQKIRDYIERNT